MTDISEILDLTVTPHDNMTYLVRSSTGKKHYLVDLMANGGSGECMCPHFQMRILPVINGNSVGDDAFEPYCKHIIRCQLWLARGMIAELIKRKLT